MTALNQRMADDMGSIDCPDCQLQMLQQQNQTASQIPEQSQGQPSSHEITHSNRSLQEINMSLMSKPVTYSQDTINPHYQLGSMNSSNSRVTNSSSGNSCMNVYYGSDSGNYHGSTTSLGNSGNSNLSMSMASTSIGIAGTTPTPSQGCDMNLSAAPIEPCDFNGFCSTCAVLELPTNDKFYRSTNSRPHVFPPIFYPQGPSSVIPCFSPIPDWNEYNHYAYPTPYSQSTATVAPTPSDYYGSSSVACPSSSTSTFDIPNTNSDVHSSSAQLISSYSIPCSSIYNNTNIRSDCSSAIIDCDSKKTSGDQPKTDCPTDSAMSISSSTSSSDISDIDSSCDSEIGDSILSEDRELISVVEDDEDESNNTKHMSQTCESVRSDGKCWICQNHMEITDCSSPQLAKMLENIDDDITAEDLDITVSSGDIEIGGIEDEVKDFQNNLKKRNLSGNSQGIFSISRLAGLLGASSRYLMNSDTQGTETDIAILCFRCGKLAALADSLERQLSSTIHKLQQKIISSHSLPDITPLPFTPAKGFRFDEGSQNSYPPLQYRRCYETKGTQTKTDSEEDRFNCKSEMFNLQKCLGLEHIDSESNGRCISQEGVDLWKPDDRESNIEFVSQSCLNEQCSPSAVVCIDQSESPVSFLGVDSGTLTDRQIENNEEEIEHRDHKNPTHNNPHQYGSDEDIGNKTDWSKIEIESESIIGQRETDLNQNHTKTINCSINSSEEQCDTIPEALRHDSPVSSLQFAQNDSGIENLESEISVVKLNSCRVQGKTLEDPPLQIPKSNQNLPSCCLYCQRVFSTKSNMKAHVEICKFKVSHEQNVSSLLADKRCMECPKCGLRFRSAIRRKKHMDHGCKSTTFECEQCSKRFSKNSELQAHMNIHRGEKPFKCELCEASFSTRGNQIAHSRTHSNSKKFPCNHCDKGFNRRYALIMHLNRHNGIKPFTCTLCNKSFSDPSNLKAHMNVHMNLGQKPSQSQTEISSINIL